MHYESKEWKIAKIIICLGDIILLTVVILTFFLLYEILVSQSVTSSNPKWLIYIFILFTTEILSSLFSFKKSEPAAQGAKLLLLAISFIFSVLLLVSLRTMNFTSPTPMGIVITIVVLIGVLLFFCLFGLSMAWRRSLHCRQNYEKTVEFFEKKKETGGELEEEIEKHKLKKRVFESEEPKRKKSAMIVEY